MKKIIYSPGEPAGIGPDLILQLCKTKTWSKFLFPIVVIGDKKLFEERAFLLKKNIKLVELNDIEKASKNKAGVIQVYKVLNCKNFDVGKIHKSNANYV